MALVLHGHPFSSYCQKVVIAFNETNTPFIFAITEGEWGLAELKRFWAHGLMPVLRDEGTTVVESSIIIEHVAPQLVRTLEVRFLDRFFDLHVMTPMQKIVLDVLRPAAERDARGVADARARLDISYVWLEGRLSDKQWAAGKDFTMADCAAAPSLFYADWAHPISERFPILRAYRARLLARLSVARTVDDARPYRSYFPLGAPDRD